MIDFKMIDLSGRWRHITIPAERFGEDTMKYGIGFDGSNYGYAPIEKSDMVFIPNIESAQIDPYVDIPTLSMMGDVCIIGEKENRPFDQYPRNVAMAAVKYMQGEGIADEMIIGPEFEFHVFDHVCFESTPQHVGYRIDTKQAVWNTGLDNGANNGYEVPPQGRISYRRSAGYHIQPPLQDVHDAR